MSTSRVDRTNSRETIYSARREVGLTAPIPEEKELVWSRMSIPQAGVWSSRGGYRPNRIALQAHNHPARSVLLTGGSRGGKSLFCAAEVVAWTPHSDLIWFAAENYDLTRQEFEYTAEALLSLGWTASHLVNISDDRYRPATLQTYWGCLIECRTLQDVTSMVARAPDIVVICEPGLAPEWSLRRARERLTTRRGRLLMAGTFEASKSPWLEDIWKRWVRWPNPEGGKSFAMPTWLNHHQFPGGREDPEIRALKATCIDTNEFLRRVVGVPARPEDVIMAGAWDPRTHVAEISYVRRDEYGNLLPVYLAIDPGYSSGHYVVLAIQVVNGRILVVDEVALRWAGHPEVMAVCQNRPWWPAATTGTCDPYAGNSRIFGAASVVQEWWERAQVNLVVPQRLLVEDQISLIRTYLRPPEGDSPILVSHRCAKLIEEMRNWRRRPTAEGYKPQRSNCDAIKALSSFLVWYSSGLTGETTREEDVSLTW